MEFDRDKAEEVVMALLALTSFEDHGVVRAWKSHDWDLLDGLFRRGWIQDPKGKAKSVVLTEAGHARAQELFDHYFGSRANKPQQATRPAESNRGSRATDRGPRA